MRPPGAHRSTRPTCLSASYPAVARIVPGPCCPQPCPARTPGSMGPWRRGFFLEPLSPMFPPSPPTHAGRLYRWPSDASPPGTPARAVGEGGPASPGSCSRTKIRRGTMTGGGSGFRCRSRRAMSSLKGQHGAQGHELAAEPACVADSFSGARWICTGAASCEVRSSAPSPFPTSEMAPPAIEGDPT
jgi:hypothetical protein